MNQCVCGLDLSKPRFSTRRLQGQLVSDLKTPIGKLIQGSVHETRPKVMRFVSKLRPTLVVAVGDEVSRLVSGTCRGSTVLVFDRRTKRERAAPLGLRGAKIFHVRNPAGFIFPEAREVIKKVVAARRSATVEVDGEEDLLALPAMAYAPLGSIVIYGQPDEGVVVSIVDEARRKFARRFMRRMEIVR